MGEMDLPILLIAGLVLLGIFWLGFLSIKIKFPSVILYILFGILLADALYHNELLHFASEIGIVLLFFLLGLEFKLERLGGIAKRIWPAGLMDVLLNLGVVMAIGLLFHLDFFTAFLIGGIAYATSSSITAKQLGDTGRMANRETEFILGLLIFEDIVAPIVVAVLMGMSSGGDFSSLDFIILLGKIIALTIGAIILSKTLFKRFEEFLDRIADEDFRIALLIGISLAYGGLALLLGLSEVLGAFLAGMMLAEVKIEKIEHPVEPIKNLMLPLFFVYFGTTVELGDGVPMVGFLITVLVWSIIAKVLVGMIGGRLYGLSKRLSFRAGLSICARGEFSVVIASLATGIIKVFAGIYIIISAFIGLLLFEKAPQITNLIYGKPKKKPQKNLKVPSAD
jgi:monovalent cation:H+ antiporter-2, CPA2 family